MGTGDTEVEENGRAEKLKGDDGATQRSAATGTGCHTLAGGTSWSGTGTQGARVLGGCWTHSGPGTAVGFGAMCSGETSLVLDAAWGRGFSLFPTLSPPASTSHWQTQLEDKRPQSLGKAVSGHLSSCNAEQETDEERVWEPIGPELAEVTAVLVFQVCPARLGCFTPCLKLHLCWELQKSGEGFDLQCDSFFFF